MKQSTYWTSRAEGEHHFWRGLMFIDLAAHSRVKHTQASCNTDDAPQNCVSDACEAAHGVTRTLAEAIRLGKKVKVYVLWRLDVC